MTSNPSFGLETSATEVANAYPATGKIILITGVSRGGIGEATARAFAQAGASIIMITGRNEGRLSDITNELTTTYPLTIFKPYKFDLNSLKEVRQSAQAILNDSSIPRIDILVANAAIILPGASSYERVLNADGFESHFGTNYLGHFLLVTTLFPKLRASAQNNGTPGATRIVILTSSAMLNTPFRFSDYNIERPNKGLPDDEKPNWNGMAQALSIKEHDNFEGNVAYGQSKTASTLFAVHLNKVFASAGYQISAFSVDPGLVASIGLENVLVKLPAVVAAAFEKYPKKTIDQGAATTIVAALDPGLKPGTGAGIFLNNCQFGEAPAWATDTQKAERLWKLSEELVSGS